MPLPIFHPCRTNFPHPQEGTCAAVAASAPSAANSDGIPEERQRRQQRQQWQQRRRRTAATIMLVLASGLGIRWYDVNYLLPLRDTSPLPERANSSSSSGPNAAHFYAAAADALTEEAIRLNTAQGYVTPAAELPEQQAAVAANTEALRLLRMGFTYRYQGQATRWVMAKPRTGLSGSVPNYVIQRQLARLLGADARVKAAAGESGAALQACLDLIRLGRDIGSNADDLMGAMIGQLILGIGLEEAQRSPQLVSTLSAPEARAAAQRLEALVENAPTAADAMRSEKNSGSTMIHAELQFPKEKERLIGNRPTWFNVLRYGKQGMLDSYNGYMDAAVHRASLPYPLAREAALPPIPSDPICQASIPNVEKVLQDFAKKQMQSRLLLTDLALQAYRQEHRGASPTALAVLTQGTRPYLSRVPCDPFSSDAAAPLQYRGGKACSLGSSKD